MTNTQTSNQSSLSSNTTIASTHLSGNNTPGPSSSSLQSTQLISMSSTTSSYSPLIGNTNEEVLALKDQLKYQEQIINELRIESEKCRKDKEVNQEKFKEYKEKLNKEMMRLIKENEKLSIDNDQLYNEKCLLENDIKQLRDKNQLISSEVFRLNESINFNKEKFMMNEHINNEYIHLQKKYLTLGEKYQHLLNEYDSLKTINIYNMHKNDFDRDYDRIYDKQNKELRMKLDLKLSEIEQLKDNEKNLEISIREKDLTITALKQLLDKCKSKFQTCLESKSIRIDGLLKINSSLQREISLILLNIGSTEQSQHARRFLNENRDEVFTDLIESNNQSQKTCESNKGVISSTENKTN